MLFKTSCIHFVSILFFLKQSVLYLLLTSTYLLYLFWIVFLGTRSHWMLQLWTLQHLGTCRCCDKVSFYLSAQNHLFTRLCIVGHILWSQGQCFFISIAKCLLCPWKCGERMHSGTLKASMHIHISFHCFYSKYPNMSGGGVLSASKAYSYAFPHNHRCSFCLIVFTLCHPVLGCWG